MTHSCLPIERPIDLVHLARQTLGDRELEREILTLFVRQSVLLSKRLLGAVAETEKRDLAHTLRGSAVAVGAWRVAKAAEEVELTLQARCEDRANTDISALSRQIQWLASCIDEANSVILALSPEPEAAK